MNRNYFLLITFLVLLIGCNRKENTEVLVLPSIHGAHKSNPNYNYKDLFEVVRKYDPSVIGIEIRPEDMKENREYLDPYYPEEMMMLIDSFPQKTRGIDSYGAELEGKLLSKDLRADTTSQIGRFFLLQKRMNQDSVLIQKEEELGIPAMQKEQMRIALNYSPQQMINGEYDSITGHYYHVLDSLLQKSSYEDYVKFNSGRDLKITENALGLIEANEGKKVMIVIGANHRKRLMDSLATRKGIKVVENLDFEKNK